MKAAGMKAWLMPPPCRPSTRQTFSGVTGMSICPTSSASQIAETMAGGAPQAPPSPAPFTPRSLFGQGTMLKPRSKSGASAARGMQ